LFVAGSFGCGKGEPPSQQRSKPKKVWRIAVIPKGTSHDFWNNVEAGAKKADEEFEDVEIVWRGPPTEGETSQQINTVENFVVEDFDGICLAPLDANALRAPVELAILNKIPIVIFDSALEDMDGIVSYVASDNLEGGRLAGEYLAELLGQKGKVILLRYHIQSESTNQREIGFMEVMEKYPEIEILSENQFGGTTEDVAIVKSNNLLLRFGDVVDGIFCPNESNTSGMLNALRRNKPERLSQIKFVGFDAGEILIDGLQRGELHGTVLQDPVQMGYDAVRVMRDRLLKQTVPDRIPTRLHVVRHDKLDDPLTVELLRPTDNHSLLKK
jgi:ribose transport system substrate-binding protein